MASKLQNILAPQEQSPAKQKTSSSTSSSDSAFNVDDVCLMNVCKLLLLTGKMHTFFEVGRHAEI